MKLARRILWSILALALVVVITFIVWPVDYSNALLYLHEDASGIESRYVRVEGIRVHYLCEGPKEGPPVVLIHGLGSNAEDWRNLAPYLAKAGFHVYIPDLPGYGRSQKPHRFSYSIHDEAGVVVKFLDGVGLKQVDLGGWSMGGWIVQLVAADHPERIHRLMLFDSVGLNVQPTWNTNLFVPQNKAELAELEALLMPNPPKVPGYVADDIVRTLLRNGWVVHRALASMLAGNDATDKLLPTLKMPVLIEWGQVDQIAPVAQAETIHRLIPQSQLDVYPNCGHLAPLQCTAQMGPRVVQFLKE
jgi:pimeloyl-ACP methyl ester carboxylesterase